MSIFFLSGLLLLFWAVPVVVQALGQERAVAWLLGEDGIYETVGTLSCTAAAIVFGYLFFTRHRLEMDGVPRRNGWYVLISIALLFISAEELNWGQRQLQLVAPAWVYSLNAGGELSIHTAGPIEHQLNVFLGAGIILYFGLLPFAAGQLNWVGTKITRWRIPVAPLSVAWATLLTAALAFLPTRISAQETAELFEGAVQVLMGVFACHTYRRHMRLAEPTARALRQTNLRLVAGLTAILIVLTGTIGYRSITMREPVYSHELYLCRELTEEGRYKEAAAHLNAAAELRPEGLRILYLRAHLYLLADRVVEAEQILRSMLERYPDHEAVHKQLIVALLQLSNRDAAQTELAGFLTNHPQDIEMMLLMGHLYFQDDDYEEAATWFKAVLAIDPYHDTATDLLEFIESNPQLDSELIGR